MSGEKFQGAVPSAPVVEMGGVVNPMSPAAQSMGDEGRPRVMSVALGGLQTIPGCEVVGDAMLPPGYGMIGRKQGVLTRRIDPGDKFQAEPGAMLFMSEGVKMQSSFGSLGKVVHRAIGGEDLTKVKYTNSTDAPQYVGVTPNQPMACVVPVHLGGGGAMNVKRGSYLRRADISPMNRGYFSDESRIFLQ